MAATSNILPKDNQWIDHRLLNVFHTGYAFSAEPPKTVAECKERADFTKTQVRLAAGLDPMPQKMPLNPIISDSFKHEGTIISKVRIEYLPGVFLTGNLYSPERVKIQAPGILCPHGHCENGRLQNDDTISTPLFCMMLARLGFIVFSYDMLGYNDSTQILHKWPLEMQREFALSGISPYGLQTLASLRALDFLCDMEQVDERRIGITGAGAGASQAWTAALLDERIRVIVPAGRLSSHFHGQCACENGPLLRINGITSFDVLCACAPRPLLLPAATLDGTNLNPRYEIPALRSVYALFDAEDAISSFQLDEGHNFDQNTRQRVYPWFTHWLLNQSLRAVIQEDQLTIPEESKLRIFPPTQKPNETSTHKALTGIIDTICNAAMPLPEQLQNPNAFRQERRDLVGAIVNNDQELKHVAYRVTDDAWKISKGHARGILVSRRDQGDIIPAIHITPDDFSKQKPVVLLLAEGGKKEFFAGGSMTTLLDILLENKCSCLAADILGTGETAPMLEKTTRNETDPLFYSYNQTLFSMRVQDILSLLTLLHEDGFEKIILLAQGNTLKPALAALAVTKPIYGAALNFEGEGNDNASWLLPLNFQPMIRKVGAMPGLAALANTRILGLYQPTPELAEYVSSFAEKTGVPKQVTIGRESFLRLVDYVVGNFK